MTKTEDVVERLRRSASSHEWFVAAVTEHYNRMAEEAGSDPLPERASQSDHAPVMREAADTIERLREENARVTWQPIEGAPKDGAHFLAWTICRAPGDVAATYQYEIARWTGRHFYARLGIPTHWMPLPEPPRAALTPSGDDN